MFGTIFVGMLRVRVMGMLMIARNMVTTKKVLVLFLFILRMSFRLPLVEVFFLSLTKSPKIHRLLYFYLLDLILFASLNLLIANLLFLFRIS